MAPDARCETAAGSENERNAIALDTTEGAVGLVQIAGRVARASVAIWSRASK
jgi:phosphatidylserine decarboxylase